MMAPWQSGPNEARLRRMLLSPLLPLSWVYSAGAGIHRGAYERGILARHRLGCAVVSVGSLTVGGAGKTPVAAWLARSIAAAGRRVALASRGYGRRSRMPVTVVSDGQQLLTLLRESGDEAPVLASHAPGVPVLVGSRRSLVGMRAISVFDSEVLVLDDGFAHHGLARDLEVLVFDASAGLGNRCVLPRGPLRERASTASRADAIFVLDGALCERDEQLLEEAAPDAIRCRARRRPTAMRALRGGKSFSPELLRGAKVGMLCAVGNPESFRRTLESLGASVVAECRFPDHHRYRARDLRSLARHAAIWLTTEKDAIKLQPDWARGLDLRVLRIELEVEEASVVSDALTSRLFSKVGEAVQGDASLLAAASLEERAA